MLADNIAWLITGVYGPQSDVDKILFLQEIIELCVLNLPAWLLLGDFNIILSAQEKNNTRLNLPMINKFRVTVDNLELVRIDLRGRKFTWCNGQQSPTMTRIDHLTLANLERAQEERPLSQEERQFKKYLKNKSMGIAAIQKSRARQH
jgi:hypothetical protein